MELLAARIRLWVLGSLLICSSSTSAAQASRDSIVQAGMHHLSQGETIRVSSLGSHTTGWFQGMRADTVLIGAPGRQPAGVRLSAIDTLWRRGTRAKRGAKIGVVTGALLGGYAGIVFVGLAGAEGGSTNRIGSEELAGGLVGALAGGAAGALVGAGIGAAIKFWDRIHP